MIVDLIIKNGTCVSHDKIFKADIAIKKGKIFKIGSLDDIKSKQTIDAKGMHILPGAFDSQCHFREPGGEHKEDLKSGSMAAVAGGITSIFDMPNNKPSITTEKLFKKKLALAKNRMFCEHAFYMGAEKDNIAEINKVEKLDGCCGIKIFVGSSTGTLLVSDFSDIGNIIKKTRKRVSLHSEEENLLNARKKYIKDNDVKSHIVWRNPLTALTSTKKLVAIANKLKKKIHILHITTKEEVALLAKNKKYVSFEITPQHVSFYAPDCYDKLGTYAQMNPPIRTIDHYKKLRWALKNSVVDVIGSDHAPHSKREKNQKYPNSPSGMPGVQTLLPVLLDLVAQKLITLNQVVQMTSYNVIKIFNIKNKGKLETGYDADFSIVDINKKHKITNAQILSKCKWTPYHGTTFQGKIIGTIIRGNKVYWKNKIVGKPQGLPIKFN
jgi:dihydroorotase|tara:strand:- start:1465 stop:2778 length:1314 start_codon:yes stop_codon:yes gene_type:complete